MKKLETALGLTEGVDIFCGYRPEQQNQIGGGVGAKDASVFVIESGTEAPIEQYIGGGEARFQKSIQIIISGERGRFEKTRLLAKKIQTVILDDDSQLKFNASSALIPLGFAPNGSYVFSMNFLCSNNIVKSHILIGKTAHTQPSEIDMDNATTGMRTYDFSRSQVLAPSAERLFAAVNSDTHIGYDLSLFIDGAKDITAQKYAMIYQRINYTVLVSTTTHSGSKTAKVE